MFIKKVKFIKDVLFDGLQVSKGDSASIIKTSFNDGDYSSIEYVINYKGTTICSLDEAGICGYIKKLKSYDNMKDVCIENNQ